MMFVAAKAPAELPCVPSWTPLGPGVAGYIMDLRWLDGRLYAAGQMEVPGDPLRRTTAVTVWDGANWSLVGPYLGRLSGFADDIEVFDFGFGPQLCVGGWFQIGGTGTTYAVARFDGTNWVPVGGGLVFANEYVVDLHPFDDGSGPALFATGRFTQLGTVQLQRLAKWTVADGWTAAGSITGPLPLGWALCTHDFGDSTPQLILGGHFTAVNGVSAQNLAAWNGVNWSPIGSGVSGATSLLPTVFEVASIPTPDGPRLWAAGTFTQPIRGVAEWDGATWVSRGTAIPPSGTYMFVGALHRAGGNVYYGGSFPFITGVSGACRIARWDPLEESLAGMAPGLGPGGYSMGQWVEAITSLSDGTTIGPAVYAAGNFDIAGSIAVRNIARWACVRGDLNCDGVVDFFDIDPFLLALFDPAQYAVQLPGCSANHADINADQNVDFFDIDPFLECLFGLCP